MKIVVVGDTVLTEQPRGEPGGAVVPGGSALGLLAGGDLVIANLEAPLIDSDLQTEKEMTIRIPTSAAALLAELGVDVVSLATNHALDHGETGLLSSLSALDAAGVRHAGAGRTLAEADAGVVVETADGTSVAVLSFCSTLPAGSNATSTRPGIAPVRIDQSLAVDGLTVLEQPGTPPFLRTAAQEADVVRVEERLRAAKRTADRVVACIHWGVPWAYLPENQGPLAQYQQPLGRRMVDAGADVVVGTHPHCLHPVERWNDGVILYSAGNYLFSPGEISTPELHFPLPYDAGRLFRGPWFQSAVFELDLTVGNPLGVRLVPITLDRDGEPWVADAETAARTLAGVESRSREIDPAVRIHSDGTVDFGAA